MSTPIKQQYLLAVKEQEPPPDDDVAERQTGKHTLDDRDAPNGDTKRRRKEKSTRGKGGQNKGRRFAKQHDELGLCWRTGMGLECPFGSECKYTHDVKQYLSLKGQDIRFPLSIESLRNTEPFVEALDDVKPSDIAPSIDLNTKCPVFEATGKCDYGLKCRFLGGHVSIEEDAGVKTVTDDMKALQLKSGTKELNNVPWDSLKAARNRNDHRPISEAYLKELDENNPAKEVVVGEDGEALDESEKDTPDVPMRFNEKKRLHWQGLTYLAPLTTVGNLPFRRLCVDYGADITCGEMGLATSLLSASKEEWSLIRRHPSERIFGAQLAGNNPKIMVPAAEVLAREVGKLGDGGQLDFVDINCGCPIDLIFKAGSGSALLDSPGKLGKIIHGMNRALGDIPVTIKVRTGVREGKNTAHRLMPRIGSRELALGAMAIHGRTRQQRYTKLADWTYIGQCVSELRAAIDETEDAMPVPIFGGGDVYSAAGYYESLEKSGVDGIMVARGALIKPWVFAEIKERREWDISSRERLDGIRKFAEYGMSHFGTDTAGVNTTRRYLCEALSFQHRYVPIGLLEVLPGRINDRPPAYFGRDPLETLLASPQSSDWVKISEMFLGPAPDSWSFIPKHKSSAYGSEEANG